MSTEYERGLEDAKKHKISTEDNWLRATFGPILFIGLPLGFTYWYVKRATAVEAGKISKKGGNPISDMMEAMMPIKKREFRVDVKGTKFDDVIGIPEAKEEVKQYVDFLTNPKKFMRLGARLPKGCMLTGEPGTGKTLLAKAVAGEADVPFFSCSGADFIEVMGGSGPKRVRDLFTEARAASPCIVFIDEIDAIGSRGGGSNNSSVSSEENRTINQLLAELDGLATGDDAIVVLGATNFVDNIDKALMREGRFDRKVNVEMPDLNARVEIFEHYLNKVCTGDPKGKVETEEGEKIEVDDKISNKKLATRMSDLTPGLSPATIATIVNEAALQSGIKNKKTVDMGELYEAIDNTQLGKKHRNRMSDKALERTAIHEAGHAITAWMLPQQKNVLKISVTPRGMAAGYTQRAGSEFHEYQTNATLFTDMVVMLGGRAAEEVIIGNASTGAMDDVQRATEIVTKKLLSFGMSPNTGLLSYHPDSTKAGRSFVHYSEGTQAQVEAEAIKIMEEAHQMSLQLIRDNKDKLNTLVKELVEKKELVTEDCERIWGPRPSAPTTDDLAAKLEKMLMPSIIKSVESTGAGAPQSEVKEDVKF